MPISANNVTFNKSVGTVGAVSSLGGAIGAVLTSQTTEQPTIITGVYIAQAFGNAPGYGNLTYNPANQQLGWKAPGSATTVGVIVAGAGTYALYGADGSLVVSITPGALPSIYKIESLLVSNPIGTLFGQVTGTMSLVGDVQYRCCYFKNLHPTLNANDIRLYLHVPAPLPQLIAIGVDPAGAGNGTSTGVAGTIASADTAPAGVVFSAPTQAATGIQLGSLGPGQSIAFWQRRTVPPMAYGPLAFTSVTLGVALVG